MVIQYNIKFENDELIVRQSVNPGSGSDTGGTGTSANPDDGGSGTSASTDKGGSGTSASTDKGGTGSSASTDKGGKGLGGGRFLAIILGTVIVAETGSARSTTTTNGNQALDLTKEPEVLGLKEVQAAAKGQVAATRRNASSKEG